MGDFGLIIGDRVTGTNSQLKPKDGLSGPLAISPARYEPQFLAR